MIRIQRILVRTDFSACSEPALKYAAEFATSMAAKLYVLHVAEYSKEGGDPSTAKYIIPEYLAEADEKSQSRLNQITDDLKRRGVDAHPRLVAGRAYADIVQTAEDMAIDLIVIATHGRTGFSHLVFGSTAEKVVRLARCPVLTVKPQASPLAA